MIRDLVADELPSLPKLLEASEWSGLQFLSIHLHFSIAVDNASYGVCFFGFGGTRFGHRLFDLLLRKFRASTEAGFERGR